MKFMYVNDTKNLQHVYRDNFTDFVGYVEPNGDHIIFNLDIPEGHGVFIKTWENGTVLISDFEHDNKI